MERLDCTLPPRARGTGEAWLNPKIGGFEWITGALYAARMLGNRLGWLLSLCIVTMTALFLWSIHYIGNRMPEPGPVGLNAASYTMTLPADPRTVATWMSEDLDATPLYHQAI